MRAQSVAIQGVVTDRNTGQPMAGVTVENQNWQPLTTTDANGTYSLTAAQLNDVPTGALIFQLPEYYANVVPYSIAASPTIVNDTLLYGGTVLQGTVTDASTGAAIVGATVHFQTNGFSANGGADNTQTTTGGQYSYDASYFLEGTASGFTASSILVSATGYFYDEPNSFTVNPPFPATQNFTLVPTAGIALQGTVTDRNTGQPLAGVTVENQNWQPLTTTDASGSYSLTAAQLNDVPSGALIFQLPEYYANVVPYSITGSPTIVNDTLLYGGTVLQGTVTDASTGAGIVGATVHFQTNGFSANGGADNTQTTTGGQYSYDASYFLEGTASGFTASSILVSATGYFYDEPNSFTVNPPFPATQNFTLVPTAGVAIQGTVTDRNTGQPLAGVVVENQNWQPLTTTDASGSYSLTAAQLNDVPSGALIFQLPEYYANVVPYSITGSPTIVNGTLLYGGTVLQGTVTDASTGAAIVGATVHFQTNGFSANGGADNTQTTTGGQYSYDASYFLEGAPSGFTASSILVSATGYFDDEPSSFTVNPPFPATQNFSMISNGLVNVTVATAPAGLMITADGTSYVSPQVFEWNPSNDHTLGAPTPQAGTEPGIQYVFANWSDNGAATHTILIPGSPTTYTASFNTQYLLTTSSTPIGGGSVTPGGWFSPGTTVSIVAMPSAGYQFSGFSGALSGATNPQLLTMNGPESVVATFTPILPTPTITWPTPAAITYGTALNGTQLDATATYNGAAVAGTFTYTPGKGTVLSAGSQTLSVLFTPKNTSTYSPATDSVVLQVNQATPKISWAKPGAISYGTALGSTQLDATANVAGSFSYSPDAGTVLTAGTHTLSVTFTPTDTTDYSTVSDTVSLTVNPASPGLNWATPSAIGYGTPLSSTQLDATASVAGTFAYSPAAGTVLAGGSHTLSVTFTPTDSMDYSTAKTSVTLQVSEATPTINWATPAAIAYGTALTGTQLDATATYNGAAVGGTFTYTPAKGTMLTAGSQTLTVTFTPSNTTDYGTPAPASVTLEVNQATPKITWAKPAAITFGTALSATQLNATANVPGTFVYSPGSGTVLPGGTQNLSVTFSPTDATDYATVSDSVAITVKPATSTTAMGSTSPNPSSANEPVTVNYAVSGSGGIPTGTVTVTASTGETCSGTLVNGSGSCSLTFTAAGSPKLTASYSGDSNFKASTSAKVTQTVN